jgi:hypothetical protein
MMDNVELNFNYKLSKEKVSKFNSTSVGSIARDWTLPYPGISWSVLLIFYAFSFKI